MRSSTILKLGSNFKIGSNCTLSKLDYAAQVRVHLSVEYPQRWKFHKVSGQLVALPSDLMYGPMCLSYSFLLPLSKDEASRSPSLPGVTGPHYVIPESSSSVGGKAAPPTKEKPKRNGGRGIEDVRPSVESLLDELESSVPSPV